MAIQWMDDFTSYGTDTNRALRLLDGPYGAIVRADLQADPDPSSGGAQVLHFFGGGTGGEVRKVLSSAQTTVGVAARYWLAALPSATSFTECPRLAQFKDNNNIIHVEITVNPSGYIEAYRQDSGVSTLIATSSSPIMTTNTWRHLEAKWVGHATAGSVEVRAEGITVLTVSGIRTFNNVGGALTSSGMVSFAGAQDSGSPSVYVKDFIVWDGTGTTNNDFMGSCIVYKIVPQSDASLNWTTSSGATGFNLINDTTPDDDTGYITAPFPAPSPSTFNMTDLPANVSSVRGVMTFHRSKKTDGGDGNVQASVISGANTGNGADRPITTAYTYWYDVFDKDPSGSSWTKTLVNALQLKLNRTL